MVSMQVIILAAVFLILWTVIVAAIGRWCMRSSDRKRYTEVTIAEELSTLKERDFHREKRIKELTEIIDSQRIRLKGIASIASGITKKED